MFDHISLSLYMDRTYEADSILEFEVVSVSPHPSTSTAPHPTISNLTSDPGSKVVVGRVDQLRLTCTARGTREAVDFTWRLNSTSYIPQSHISESYFTSTITRSTLTIAPVTTQHNGNYRCTSTNTATGETDISTLYIQVIGGCCDGRVCM